MFQPEQVLFGVENSDNARNRQDFSFAPLLLGGVARMMHHDHLKVRDLRYTHGNGG
jgi:hypothetical protein